MNSDMCVMCDDGIINIRVGAIIMKDGKVLMVENSNHDYYYSVGGRIKFGERAEDAVVREVFEETGARLDVDRLLYVAENYFIGDFPAKAGRIVYEVSFYYLMKTPRDFEPVCQSVTEDGYSEFLRWVDLDTDKTIYPAFFKTELLSITDGVKFFSIDERQKNDQK